jgi:hypothetical protein
LQIADDLLGLLEGTRDLLPGDELGDLLRELPELLEVDVTIGQSEKGENFGEIDRDRVGGQHAYLFEQPSLRKYKSLTSSEKNGMTIRSRSSVAPAERHIAAFSVDR